AARGRVGAPATRAGAPTRSGGAVGGQRRGGNGSPVVSRDSTGITPGPSVAVLPGWSRSTRPGSYTFVHIGGCQTASQDASRRVGGSGRPGGFVAYDLLRSRSEGWCPRQDSNLRPTA